VTEITVEYLKERMAELRLQLDDAFEQLGAVKGSMQFCGYLIQELEKEGGEEKPLPNE
jgi:hypothetical protein